jgi:HEAT repeat protein
MIVAALFIIVPFLAWYGTWFGRDLSDEKITEYLADENKPRHVQHALAQIAERMEKKDPDVRRWYPQIASLSDSNVPELRSNAAWVMGKDGGSQEFRNALLKLLGDKEPIVQRNAATALVVFGDSSGRPILRSMLQSYPLTSPIDGQVDSVLKEGVPVRLGMMLARVKAVNGPVTEVRSPLPGGIQKVVVSEGTNLKTGDTILMLSPDSDTVWEALRALFFVGAQDDLDVVEPYTHDIDKMPEQVKQQATLTAKAIQSRSNESK